MRLLANMVNTDRSALGTRSGDREEGKHQGPKASGMTCRRGTGNC